MRRKSNEVTIGSLRIGGNQSIAIQSMLNVRSDDIEGNIKQAIKLKNAGCEILRVAIPDMDSIKLISAIKEKVNIPLIADIHFDYRLAIESVAAGIDKIRINPGNIGSEDRIKAVVKACNLKNIPIRIGVNSGSLEKDILKKYDHPTAEALAESALYHASLLEKFDFNNIVLSMKSSNVKTMVDAYRLVSKRCAYPLHLGVTETGTVKVGSIKSAIGIGSLLCDGIGDTIRVSLTADPVEEIFCAKNILNALNLNRTGIKFISCPTCGRTKINLIEIAEEAAKRLEKSHKNLTVAIMGCCVNGPGEAREADIGIAGGNGLGVIFKNGEIIKKVSEEKLLDELIFEIEKM